MVTKLHVGNLPYEVTEEARCTRALRHAGA